MPDINDLGGTNLNWFDLNQPTYGTSVGEAFGRWWNDVSGKSALNAFNSAQATQNRQFQAYMSNTAYQRAAADMKAAGINPASLGGNASMSPASTPSGYAASAASGSSGGGIVGLVLQGIGMGLKASVMRSALSNKEGYLDLAKFKAKSEAALNAAKVVESDASSALKVQERAHKAKMYNEKRTETWYTQPELDFEEEAKKSYDYHREQGHIHMMPYHEFRDWYYNNEWNHGKPKRLG